MPTDDLRCEAEIPGYTEARVTAAAQFISGHWGVELNTFEADQQREAAHDAALGT